jgi:UDP-N-acetylmuramoylalanine--D-glutamate ligase
MSQWNGQKVLVLGLGDTGLSMTRWLARTGAIVSAADTRAEPPHASVLRAELPDVKIATGAFDKALFASADAIAISPGIDRREPLVAQAIGRGVPVVGDVEIFARELRTLVSSRTGTRPNVIAITGSNGKSTVTAMAGDAARAAGAATVVAGNIGLPVLDALSAIEKGANVPDVFVIELSSFQLESTTSLDADAATVLNISEDHLDRYDGLEDYAAAKSRVFEGTGTQVLNRLDPRSMGMARAARSIITFGADAPSTRQEWGISESSLMRGDEKLMALNDVPVAGLHNAANALAALALGSAIGLAVDPMLQGIRNFRGLPHRLEKIAEARGVSFYDDSKGTNVGATVAALSGMAAPVVLIAGGDGKGQDFSPLRAAVSSRARAVVLIGRDADRIAAALSGCGVPLLRAGTMDEAIQVAFGAAAEGDAILLSPACASYDMFRSYVHRGEVFAKAARALAAQERSRPT